MADEQELRIIASLDDRASAGLARLQATIRQLGTGPQAAGMESMRRQANEAGEGMNKLSSSISGMGLAAGAIPLAMAGMAASFAASGIIGYADHVTKLGREARATGVDLAQFRKNIETLKTAGITEEEATKQLRAFTDTQVELAQKGSQTFQRILAATGEATGNTAAGRQNMMNFLNEIAILPQEEALQKVKAKGQEIYQAAFEFRMQEAQQMGLRADQAQAYAERMAREAERSWAAEFGAPALANITELFEKATAEEKKIWAERQAQSEQFTRATNRISNAWSGVKTAIASAFVTEDATAALGTVEEAVGEIRTAFESVEFKQAAVVIVKAFAGFLREALAAARAVGDAIKWIDANLEPFNRFMANPSREIVNVFNRAKEAALNLIPQGIIDFVNNPGQGIANMLRDFAANVPRLASGLQPIIAFFENPRQQVLDLVTNIQNSIRSWIPEEVRQFFEAVDQALLNFANQVKDTIAGWIPQSVKDFFENPVEGLLNLSKQIDEAINGWVIQPIKDFFSNPGQTFYNMVNWIIDRFEDLDRVAKPFIDFITNPAQGILNLLDNIKQTLANLLPPWARKLLGVGGGEGAAPAPAVAEVTPAQREAWQAVAAPAAAAPELTEEAALAKLSPEERAGVEEQKLRIQKLIEQTQIIVPADVEARQAGGPVQAGQPIIVGERGPELMVPRGGGEVISSDGIAAALTKAAPTALWAASKLLEGTVPGISSAVHGAMRGHARATEGLGVGEAMTGLIPGAGALQTMKRDAETGHGLRTTLRGLLGIQDPGEPAPWQERGAWQLDQAQAGADLDRSAAQQVNVSGTGRIRVDVRAPEGTRVDAQGEGLFKTTEIMRQTQMLPADYGPAAATGVNAGAGTLGNGTGG